MHRRDALKLSAGLPFVATSTSAAMGGKAEKFTAAFAPHHNMFKHHAGEDILDQIRWSAEMGFTAWEDNGMPNRDVATQKKIGALLAGLDMKMGVFVANKIHWTQPSLTMGPGDHREAFLTSIREAVEVAKRCNATWMTVVPGFVNMRLEMGYQTANVVETLKQGTAILEPHGLVMVLEPLNYRDHPGLFLTKTAQAYAICKAVDSPSCKILFDIYHQQIQEGNLIPNIDLAWDEIAYYQIGDNPGRREPTTGEINYTNVLGHIHHKGFRGIFGMEHGNSEDGKAGEMKVVKAYRQVDVG